MPPRFVPSQRRVWPPAGVLLVLAVVALTASACTSQTTMPGPAAVLGQARGAALVSGKPAPGKVGELGAVACADAQRCWAVGVPGPNDALPVGNATVIVATTDGGNSWTPQSVMGGYTPELSGIACPTKNDCMAVGSNGSSSGVIVVTDNGGANWQSATTPTGAIAVDSVTCTGLAQCTALVSNGTAVWSARTDDFGQTWTQLGNLPSSFVTDGALFCSSGSTCLVPGYVPTSAGHGQGAIAHSSDGGQTWSAATLPSTAGVVQAADCVTATMCLAAGTTSTTVSDVAPGQGELLRSVDGGTTWTAATAPPVDDVYGLDCPSPVLCAMVGTNWSGNPSIGSGAVAQSDDGGTTFKTSPAAYAPISLTSIACPDTKTCIAAGGDVLARVALVAPPKPHKSSTTA